MGAQIVLFRQHDLHAPPGKITRNASTVYAATDYQHVAGMSIWRLKPAEGATRGVIGHAFSSSDRRPAP